MGDDVGGTPDVSHPRAPPPLQALSPVRPSLGLGAEKKDTNFGLFGNLFKKKESGDASKDDAPGTTSVAACDRADELDVLQGRAGTKFTPALATLLLPRLTLAPPLRPSPITPAEKKQSKPRSEPTGRTLGVECGREQERALTPSVALPPSLCHPLLWTSSSCSKCTSPPPPAPLSLLDSCLPSALRHALSSPCFPRASVPRSRRRRIALEHKRTQGRKVIIFRAQRQEK